MGSGAAVAAARVLLPAVRERHREVVVVVVVVVWEGAGRGTGQDRSARGWEDSKKSSAPRTRARAIATRRGGDDARAGRRARPRTFRTLDRSVSSEPRRFDDARWCDESGRRSRVNARRSKYLWSSSHLSCSLGHSIQKQFIGQLKGGAIKC
eukprot:30780-Pelagococcus_subviridis.AAC.6